MARCQYYCTPIERCLCELYVDRWVGAWAGVSQDLSIRRMLHWTLTAYLGKVPLDLLSFCLTALVCFPSSTIAAHKTLALALVSMNNPRFTSRQDGAENAPGHLMDDRMWSSSTHIQGHRGRIGSTRIASPSTALAPPSLACPLPSAGFAIAPCKTTESFSLFSHTPHTPRQPNTSV
jgi:hypothetical protein